MMRTALAAGLATALCACATGPGPAPPHRSQGLAVRLENADFEAEPSPDRECPPKWGCVMHADPGSFRFGLDKSGAANGRQSLRVVRVRDEPWALATQTVWTTPPIRGASMRFSIAVRSLSSAGPGAGAIFTAQNGSGVEIGHVRRYAEPSGEWQRLYLDFLVPERAVLIEVGGVIEGSGPAWFDDAHLEILPPLPK